MKEGFCKGRINPAIKELILQFIISSNGTLKNIISLAGKWKKPLIVISFILELSESN